MQWLNNLWARRDLANAALVTIGGLCLAVGGNAIYGMFAGFGWANLLIALAALALAFVLFNLLIPLLRRPTRFKAGQLTETVLPRTALITLVSLPRPGSDIENVAETAIRHHLGPGSAGGQKLKYCWLLYTHNADATQSSESEARRLQQTYSTLDCRLIRLDDGAEGKPKSVYDAVQRAYEEGLSMGIPGDQMIADATGGTKAMTIGMDLACRELNLSLECVTPQYHNNRPVGGTGRFLAIDTTGIGFPKGEAQASEPPAVTVEASLVADGADDASGAMSS